MDLIKLQYFVTVAQYLNFTRAAEALFITQPTLSRQIANLEDELTTKLFDRTRSKMALTPAGELLLSEAQQLLEHTDGLVMRLRRIGDNVKATIRIGYSGILEISFMVDMLRQLAKEYPEVDFSLRRHNLGKLTKKLNDSALDVIFSLESGLDQMPNIEFIPLFENHLKLVVSDQHPLASRQSIRLEELKNEHFLTLSRNESFLTQDFINLLCKENEFVPHIIQYAENPQTLLLLVGAGKGVALLATCTPDKDDYHVKYINLDIPGTSSMMNFVVAWNKNNNNAYIPHFVRIAKEVVTKHKSNFNCN